MSRLWQKLLGLGLMLTLPLSICGVVVVFVPDPVATLKLLLFWVLAGIAIITVLALTLLGFMIFFPVDY